MALLPGIDPRNRQPGKRKRPSSIFDRGVGPDTGMADPANVVDTRSAYPIAFKNGVMTQPDVDNPFPDAPPIRVPGYGLLDYNGETLLRNEGTFVGVADDSGIGMYNQNGKLRVNSVRAYGAPGNTWADFDSLKTAQPQQIQTVQARLLSSGLLSKGSFTPGRYDAATQAALYVAMQEGNKAGKAWWKYANELEAQSSSSGSGKMQVGDSRTQTNYSFTTRESALSLVKQAIQQDLGRDPTDGETAQFLRELRAEEKSNPVVTTTTLTSESGDTSVTSEGGVDQQAWADDYGEKVKPKKSQRYKEAQYENLLISMIGDGSL